MSSWTVPNDLVLFQYYFSPYAKRVVWYLQLRGISYGECVVANALPRPALAELNISYRRIPVLAHGRDFYCDTRLIFPTLDHLVPGSSKNPSLEPDTPEGKAITQLLSRYTGDAIGLGLAAKLIPSEMPLLQDKDWMKDRDQFFGKKELDPEKLDQERPEVLVNMRDMFMLLEHTLLADGRDWVLGGKSPSIADIEAVWMATFLNAIPGALGDHMTEKQFPKTFKYIERFEQALEKAKGGVQVNTLGDEESYGKAIDATLGMSLDSNVKEEVESDPTGLKKGDEVEMWPTDNGMSHKDRGQLVLLNPEEMAVKKESKGKEIRVHYPRWKFTVEKVGGGARL